jgi:SagB-type dehydrogenase family enzyme
VKVTGPLKLPPPRTKGDQSLEETLLKRRSRRQYRRSPLSAAEISQILWAAYGLQETAGPGWVTGKGNRTCPSAGALFPLGIYLVAGDILNVPSGLYHFIPDGHVLKMIHERDIREDIYNLSYPREMILNAPASLIYTAIERRVRERYGERGRLRYIPMDIGHSAQNVYLQAEAMGLGTCAVGAFDDDGLVSVLGLPAGEIPMYIMPVGIPA